MRDQTNGTPLNALILSIAMLRSSQIKLGVDLLADQLLTASIRINYPYLV
jgi:hypothetical protein